MDVHAPHEPVHTWKDFAIHLAVVTIGLFIALMLEALVEHVHHRHIVAEARANIRREIEHNQRAAKEDIALSDEESATMRKNVQTIRVMRTRPKNWKGELTNTISFDSLDDSAWKTARDMGALQYMPYEEVQRYSDLYVLEDLVNSRALSVADEAFQALSPTQMGDEMTMMPDAEYTRMLEGNAAALMDMHTLKQFLQQYQQQSAEVLKQ